MLYPKSHFGILADRTNSRVSIFDIDTLQVLQQIPLNADPIDTAITRDCSRAVVSTFVSQTMFQLGLCGRSARVIGSANAGSYLEDVALTPDDRFALSVDGSASDQDIVSYSLRDNAVVSALPANAQAVAVSPKGNGLVLTAVNRAGTVHRYTIDRFGMLTDTGEEITVAEEPININFSRDGNFAFVSSYFPGSVSVLSTVLPDQISLISTLSGTSAQSMAITKDGRHLFALGSDVVSIYAFDPVSGYLSFQRSFPHGLTISSFFGVDQIALDPSETRLFISAEGEVAVFTTYGTRLGTVAGVSGPGGLAICECAQRCPRRISLLGLLILIALI